MNVSFERAFQWGVVAAASAVLLSLIASQTKAADLGSGGGGGGGYKDAIVVEQAPSVNWTGIYLGGSLGYGSGVGTLSADGTLDGDSFGIHTDTGLTGFVGVLSAGADWRMPNSRWVLGLYGDYALGDRSGDILGVTFNGEDIAAQAKLNNQWAVGGRVGVIVTPGTLVFAKFGYTQADVSIDIVGLGLNESAWSDTASGFNIGGGVEMSLGSGFFLRGQYDYSDYGSVSIASGNLVDAEGSRIGSYEISEDFSDNRFTAGIIYKIGMGR
jgi:outer membrane immunogenic protein